MINPQNVFCCVRWLMTYVDPFEITQNPQNDGMMEVELGG